jgi:hypothetical protein
MKRTVLLFARIKMECVVALVPCPHAAQERYPDPVAQKTISSHSPDRQPRKRGPDLS